MDLDRVVGDKDGKSGVYTLVSVMVKSVDSKSELTGLDVVPPLSICVISDWASVSSFIKLG